MVQKVDGKGFIGTRSSVPAADGPFEDVERAAQTIMKESPMPQKTPTPPDALLLEGLRAQEAEFTNSIEDLDKSIALMQEQRDAYCRARQRVQAAINLPFKGFINEHPVDAGK